MSKGIDTSLCSDKGDIVDLVVSNASATAAAADAAARITRALTGTNVQFFDASGSTKVQILTCAHRAHA